MTISGYQLRKNQTSEANDLLILLKKRESAKTKEEKDEIQKLINEFKKGKEKKK